MVKKGIAKQKQVGKISILMSCYNSNFEYLKQQIDSIINQTEKDWELLIYNDGTNRLNQWLDENIYYSYPILYFNEGHKGYTKAYNYLLKEATGEYICFCDHDDIWEPDKLEIEKKYLDEHPEVDCVFGWLKWFGAKNKLESFSISDNEISKQLYFYQPIKQPTVMFRKDRFGEFNAPFDAAADFWFWAKHKDRHYHLIEKVMVNYRRHANEMTKDKTSFRENSAKVIYKSLCDKFGKDFVSFAVCRTLDRYSHTYNEDLKKVIEAKI